MEKTVVIDELRRVANLTKSQRVSRAIFARHATISSSVVEATFGSWNEGIVAAGLIPFPPGGVPRDEHRRAQRIATPPTGGGSGRIPDDALLDELLRIQALLGRRPSLNQLTAKGQFNSSVYVKRWGSVTKALDVARARRDGT